MHLPHQASRNVYCEQEILLEKEGVPYSILVFYTDVINYRGKIHLLARKSLDTFQSLFNHIAKACNYYDLDTPVVYMIVGADVVRMYVQLDNRLTCFTMYVG